MEYIPVDNWKDDGRKETQGWEGWGGREGITAKYTTLPDNFLKMFEPLIP